MCYSCLLLHRTYILLGCAFAMLAFLMLNGCARSTAGVQMNAFETPLPAATAVNLPVVTTLVVGPVSTSLPLSQLATATAFPTVQTSGTVNMQNAESGVSLHVGERFLLDLGERGWNIRVGDELLLKRAPDANPPSGSQGYFQALKAGKTKLYATSDPPCRQVSPPCMLPTLFLEINVTILP